jgi:hypothetical protein
VAVEADVVVVVVVVVVVPTVAPKLMVARRL